MTQELSPKALEIADFTRSLLSLGGYNSFSYADIAAQVGISKASIHHHFPSKEHLVATCVSLYRQEAKQAFTFLSGEFSHPVERLGGYFGFWTNCIENGISSFCICALLAAELPGLPETIASEVRGHFQDLTEWLATLLQEGVEKGIFHPFEDARLEAYALMSSVHGAMLAARSSGDPTMFRQLTQRYLARLLIH
ncbi:TetR/AcrR family transcriptional regulator [Pokkaliibacter sp. CJK22405]|uniref:TetR/AcrR family transcriptional regulator n=1 Tax=Pokkaliibacter sp. CJK22405 TaxID=3384615 RepID=UPI00398486E0